MPPPLSENHHDELNDIISKISESDSDTEESDLDFFKILEKAGKKTESSEERENREILDMRKLWSHWILIFIGVIIIFDIILVTFYGLGYWSFENSNVVIAVITENFLKIISLGILITTNIFTKIFKQNNYK